MARITPVNLWLNCLSAESSGVIQLDESKEFRSVRINDVLTRDPALSAAQERNLKRIHQANLDDELIIGKYLPSDPSVFFPVRMRGPDDKQTIPDDWLKDIRDVISEGCRTPAKPSFCFDTDLESLEQNGSLLERCSFNFEHLLETQKGTTAWHGSEFRRQHQLKRVLRNHPNLGYLEPVFGNGMNYHFTKELDETTMTEEREAQLYRGNHKLATNDIETVAALLQKDVTHGFSSRSQVPSSQNFTAPWSNPAV
jgi:hypothetical protein